MSEYRDKSSLQKCGFTLIELLIVVVIIGLLASIAIPRFSTVRDRAYLASMRADLKNLAHLQEVYHNNNYMFSNDLGALESVQTDGVTVTINEGTSSGWAATATHAALGTTRQCGMYHGTAAAAGGDPATVPSMVLCN